MSTLTRNLRQEITHWGITPNGFGGFDFTAPALLKGRWEDRQVQFRDVKGNEEASNALVYLNTDVAIGDYVYLGDALLTADPTTLALSFQVRQFNKIPDLRNIQMQRKAFL